MPPHRFAAYWEQGVEGVRQMTGAAAVADGRDVVAVSDALGFALPFVGRVLDVGCGTGRLARFCADTYAGVDISRDAVAWCTRNGLTATLVSGADGLDGSWDWIACLSMFTHVDVAERAAYLRRFQLMAPRLLVGVIPGDGGGSVMVWTARVPEFEQQLGDAGSMVRGVVDQPRSYGDEWLHRYYYAEAAV